MCFTKTWKKKQFQNEKKEFDRKDLIQVDQGPRTQTLILNESLFYTISKQTIWFDSLVNELEHMKGKSIVSIEKMHSAAKCSRWSFCLASVTAKQNRCSLTNAHTILTVIAKGRANVKNNDGKQVTHFEKATIQLTADDRVRVHQVDRYDLTALLGSDSFERVPTFDWRLAATNRQIYGTKFIAQIDACVHFEKRRTLRKWMRNDAGDSEMRV